MYPEKMKGPAGASCGARFSACQPGKALSKFLITPGDLQEVPFLRVAPGIAFADNVHQTRLRQGDKALLQIKSKGPANE